ncbi:MAG: tetratricopeptide repeat protein, partial [Deltaproteobacteria bacterium]|nr:tetratricopeptide repeat protein [Deltaproteobacteria bacterium]MBW2534664.1 tetratricopeptide repeat protein [Deltaproteobacteria bacterium]
AGATDAAAGAAAPPAIAPPPLPPKRKTAPPPPAPTPEQIAALEELQREADRYEQDARDYRRTITRIIKHHYEERRRRIIAALDAEIATESKALNAARLDAIARLETFIAKYSGPNAHPKATPDAMFRLAALYEERARESVDPDDPNAVPDLNSAIALYKRIINEFPDYHELAAAFYYLGHMLNDSARIGEGQQVWRSLVCHNHYPYPVPADPADPTKDKIVRLKQDHPPDWWLGWMQRHPEPMDLKREQSGEGRYYAEGDLPENADEDVFVDPYPDSCQSIPQKTLPGDQPRYVAEVWWQIGDYHFEEIDPHGGPFNYSRAERAYTQSMRFDKPPVYGVAMYKRAWTYYNQQRYKRAVEEFVRLLHYTDEQEKKTGNPGADFRSEAYAYIAGSVTFLDFEGPDPLDPFIARNDIFDLESDANIIEEKMRVGIDRVQDPELVPQNQPGCVPKTSATCTDCCQPRWTVEIYRALATEYKEYNHYHNLIDINELILASWPLHRDAPFVQNQIAEVYETLAGQSRKGTEQYDEAVKKALEARSKLRAYVGNTPWVEANKEDPEAILAAERLVRSGLRRAAADHTNGGAALVAEALKIPDREERDPVFRRALEEYRHAAATWGAYLIQDENSDDAYESRYWLADAYTNVVVIQVALGDTPSDEDYQRAQIAAREVRDSTEDDQYLQPAASMVVKVAYQRVLAQYNRFDLSGGSEGYERRTELKVSGEGDERKVVKESVPPELVQLVAAWDEYVQAVPLEADPYNNHDQFLYNAGEVYFLYGQFEVARQRLLPIYQLQCGKTKFGYLAWEKLLTMANIEGRVEDGRTLAEAAGKRSCAITEEQKAKEPSLRDPTIKLGYYVDASKAFQEAEKAPEGREKAKLWRKAAAMYKAALEKAPDHDEAPEAAMNGAFAYKQVGEYDQAIGMYELFIKEYGSEERLDKLQKGDPNAKPPKNRPDPKRYEERVKFLKMAYDTLATSYVLFFDYQTAAKTFDNIARKKRFDDETRRSAARNAVVLYANMGDDEALRSARNTFFSLAPPAEQKAEVDWLVASADLKRWDERGIDRGANRNARMRATQAMDRYYRANQTNTAASPYTVQAAYHASQLRRKGGDAAHRSWCDKSISAFETFKRNAPSEEGRNQALGSLQADMAAECEYRDLDAQISKQFDYDAGHHRYQGVITDVTKEFEEDVEKGAKQWFDKLQHVITHYESRKWAVAARARQGSLYDSCRTGLYNARPPGLKLYTDKEERLLKKLDKLCEDGLSDDACDNSDQFRANRRAKWRQTRQAYLDDADKAMVAGYAESVLWSTAWKVNVDAVDDAIQRLAFFTDIIGDEKLKSYSSHLKNPSTKQPFQYTPGAFLRMRRGLTQQAEPQVMPAPLPVIVP